MAAIPRGTSTDTSPDTGVGRNGSGYGIFARKMGSGKFHPTVISLLILLFAEFAGYAFLRYTFRSAHGG